MSKIHLSGLALITAVIFSAICASSAFAISKFLVNGEEITTKIAFAAETNFESLLLEDMSAIGKPDVLCSLRFDGSIEPGGVLGFIEKTLTLASVEEGNMVDCVDDNKICSSPVLVTAIHLPWHVEVVLSGLTYVLRILSEENKVPGYTVDCNTVLGLVEDTCTGETGIILKNNGFEVEGEFNETDVLITKPSNCTQGGPEFGLFKGGILISFPSGTLSVSG